MNFGQLAQLVRAFGSHPRGHWFESSIAQFKEVAEMVDTGNMRLPLFGQKVIKLYVRNIGST